MSLSEPVAVREFPGGVRSLDELARGARLLIYADNLAGRHLRRLLKLRRPDIKVLAFVNSFEAGETDGLPRLLPSQLTGLDFDFIAITSYRYASQIVSALREAGVEPERYGLTWLSTLGHHGETLENPLQGWKTQAEQVREALGDGPDQQVWDMLLAAMAEGSVAPLAEHVFAEGLAWNEGRHYTDGYQLQTGDVVLEGGVFDGVTTRSFAKSVGAGGRVYAFDPLGGEKASAALSGLSDRVEVVRAFLADSEGECGVIVEGPATRMSEHGEGQVIPKVSVDSFVAQRKLERVDFLKLDVEGAEPEVLRGGLETILRFRPALAISIYHGQRQYLEIPHWLIQNLENYEFGLYSYSPEGLETVFYATPKEKTEEGKL